MSSMLYTMGMAIDRAHENGYDVSVLVDGCWIDGVVAANDGHGVVLETGEGHHVVVRSERIAAVRVVAESPFRGRITRGADFAPRFDGAMPMPGPSADPNTVPEPRSAQPA